MVDFRAPSRKLVLHRGAAAALLAAGAIAGLLIALLGPGDDVSTEPEAAAPTTAAVAPGVSELVARLSPAQLADQVLLIGFDGSDPSSEVVDRLGSQQLGGVLIEPRNWGDETAGRRLVDRIRTAGKAGGGIAPLIATAQEGGRYRSLPDLPPEATELQIGERGSPAAARDWARSGAQALAEAGIDLDLFPVADVATLDSPVADRAFSDDPATAAQLTATAVQGCRDAGIACAALHFPGLGAASQDTSLGPATVGLDAAGLASRDLEPFRAAFARRMPAVVLSLAFYAAYDPITPGALSAPVATGLLRDELGFGGVAITDDLGSGAVRSSMSVREAAVRALAAGSDLLQIGSPADQRGVHAAIVSAVESGELSDERLAEAAGRVLELKRRLGLLKEPPA